MMRVIFILLILIVSAGAALGQVNTSTGEIDRIGRDGGRVRANVGGSIDIITPAGKVVTVKGIAVFENYVEHVGISAPGVSPTGRGRIYFDSSLNKYRVSQNGGAYVDLFDNNHTHAESDVTSLVSDLAGKQPLDSDTTAIAALTPSNDDVIQRKSGAWVNRSIAQLKADFFTGLTSNTLPKWNGSTFVDSRITDNGTSTIIVHNAGGATTIGDAENATISRTRLIINPNAKSITGTFQNEGHINFGSSSASFGLLIDYNNASDNSVQLIGPSVTVGDVNNEQFIELNSTSATITIGNNEGIVKIGDASNPSSASITIDNIDGSSFGYGTRIGGAENYLLVPKSSSEYPRFANGVQIGAEQSQPRPTCNEDAWGVFWHVRGATGVKDTVAVCAKDATDTWAWRTIY